MQFLQSVSAVLDSTHAVNELSQNRLHVRFHLIQSPPSTCNATGSIRKNLQYERDRIPLTYAKPTRFPGIYDLRPVPSQT
jgi:hypothetical protein